MTSWSLPTTGNLALDDYRRSQSAFMRDWARKNPYTGVDPSSYGMSQTMMEEVGSGTNETRQAFADDEKYGSEGTNAWRGTLTPAQLAEYNKLSKENYAKNKKRGQIAAAASFAAIGGLGALGAGMLGGAGPGTGALGAESLAAADIAGGLIPAYGTEAAYTAGLGTYAMPVAEAALPTLTDIGAGAAELFPEFSEPWLVGSGTSATGAAGAGSAGGWTEYLKSLGTSLGKNAIKGVGSNWLNQLITGGTAAYTGNRATSQYNDLLKEINALYSPDSPYAKQMQQALARKDSAAGRNSQYGSRAVELAAALTNSKANALTSAGYGNLMQQRGLAQNQFPASMIALLQSQPGQDLITKAGGGIGSWLGGLFTSGGDKVTPTTPNTGTNPNWWENWGGYIGGGP